MKHILIILISVIAVQLQAQSGWKKLQKKGEELFEQGQYAEAADHFLKSWNEKSNTELLFKAGLCYRYIRDYKKAGDTFRQLLKMNEAYPMVGWYYAQALHQQGKYDISTTAYQSFIKNYEGEDRKKYKQLTDNAIKGCDLGQQGQADRNTSKVELKFLNEQVNTRQAEFAPVLFSDDILYFSSDVKSQTSIYRSQRQTTEWSSPVEPKFPKMPAGHVCNGSFSPDGKRFYFTICNDQEAWKNINSQCDIYVTKLSDNNWTAPRKLRDYIKMDGNTATHPNVTFIGDYEYLYYVTDRKGGQGGLDIWYTTREISSDAFDYTLPQNAGPTINTPGDEVTPFYDVASETLFFSSNGHPTLGGFDILKAKGNEEEWTNLAHLVAPFNSEADDYYFVKSSSSDQGFIVSNRFFNNDKLETDNDDIFAFGEAEESLSLSGKLLTDLGDPFTEKAQVTLYERKANDELRVLQHQRFDSGEFSFMLMPQKKYKLEATSGVLTGDKEFDTYTSNSSEVISQDIVLRKQKSVTLVSTTSAVEKPVNIKKTEDPISTLRPVTPKVEKEIVKKDSPIQTPSTLPSTTDDPIAYKQTMNDKIIPIPEGLYFKIQFESVLRFNPNKSNYKAIKTLGRLDTEYYPDKGWTRVLLADYFSLEESYEILKLVKNAGFPDAFIVRYRSGKRLTN